MLTRGITFAIGCSTLALGCIAPPDETQEIVDNLARAGFPADDIAVVGGAVYVGRDAEVSLAASREMLQTGQPLPAHACPNPPGLKGCPQQLAVDEGAAGQYIAFQTQNIQDITNSAELDSALQNAWTNSTAGMIEIYEERLWEARVKQDLDLASWDRELRDRRAQQQGAPFDLATHAHAFVRQAKGNSHVYINGTRCDPVKPHTAAIIVDP